MLASAGLEIALTSRRRFARAATLYAASDLARVALFVLPATLARGLTGLLWGAVALGAVRLVAAVVFLRAEFGPEFRTDASLLRRQLAYALPFEAAVVGEVLQANWHQVAVAHRVDAATFAIYAVGCLQVPLVDLVAGATGNVMMVTMAREVATGRLDLALRTWHDAVRKLACLFFPFVALLIACAPDLIVALFTERYRASAPIFMIWCGAFLLAALPTDAALRVFADTRGMVAIGTFKLILVVASVGAMVQRFGLDGAVVTALAAITCGKVAALGRLRTWFGRRHADLLPWGDLGGAALTAGAALLPALVVGREVALAPPARMVVIVLVYAAAYAALGGLRRLRAPGAPFGPLAEEGPVAGR
jgi:O-antigen/teichoic acid export membrane protein